MADSNVPHAVVVKRGLHLGTVGSLGPTGSTVDHFERGTWHQPTKRETGCHSKQEVTRNGMSLKRGCHSKEDVTQNRMSLKKGCHSKEDVTQ